jgi:hypothetical protein
MPNDSTKPRANPNQWGTQPSATWYDLRQLAYALVLFELVIAALAIGTRAFFGVGIALWVGVGIGALVLAAFVLVSLFGVLSHTIARFMARRTRRGD